MIQWSLRIPDIELHGSSPPLTRSLKRIFCSINKTCCQKITLSLHLKVMPSIFIDGWISHLRVCFNILYTAEIKILFTVNLCVLYKGLHAIHSWFHLVSGEGEIYLLMDLALFIRKWKIYNTVSLIALATGNLLSNFLAQVWQSVQHCGLYIYSFLLAGELFCFTFKWHIVVVCHDLWTTDKGYRILKLDSVHFLPSSILGMKQFLNGHLDQDEKLACYNMQD